IGERSVPRWNGDLQLPGNLEGGLVEGREGAPGIDGLEERVEVRTVSLLDAVEAAAALAIERSLVLEHELRLSGRERLRGDDPEQIRRCDDGSHRLLGPALDEGRAPDGEVLGMQPEGGHRRADGQLDARSSGEGRRLRVQAEREALRGRPDVG